MDSKKYGQGQTLPAVLLIGNLANLVEYLFLTSACRLVLGAESG